MRKLILFLVVLLVTGAFAGCPDYCQNYGEWGSCTGGKMSRVKYICDYTTNYTCVEQLESTTCTEVQECPACPDTLGACVDRKQKRTTYRCDAATNFKCSAQFEKRQDCACPDTCPAPTKWSNCTLVKDLLTGLKSGKRVMSEYVCNESTNYMCLQFNQTQNCTIKCPTCPAASEWTDCINELKIRSGWNCNESTEYKCVQFTDWKECGSKKDGEKCTKATECADGYCVKGLCSISEKCGDGTCDKDENCTRDCAGACMDNEIIFSEDDPECHNLAGWVEREGPTKWMTPGGYQSLELKVNKTGVPYGLAFKHYDGDCDDSFEILVGGKTLFEYQSKGKGEVESHVEVPKELVTENKVAVLFSNTAIDDCGYAGLEYVRLEEINKTNGADGINCTYGAECVGGHCLHGMCRSKAVYCGDEFCDAGELQSTCCTDCKCFGEKVCVNNTCVDKAPEAKVEETKGKETKTESKGESVGIIGFILKLLGLAK